MEISEACKKEHCEAMPCVTSESRGLGVGARGAGCKERFCSLLTFAPELYLEEATTVERRAFAEALAEIVGAENVLWQDYDLMLYEYDGSIDRSRPEAVVIPSSAEQVAEVFPHLLAV